jgi:lipoate-protein ligase B
VQISIVDLGSGVLYEAALAEQERLLEAVRTGAAPPTLLVLGHAPVLTVGRGLQGRPEGDPAPLEPPAALPEGIPVVRVARGGGITYHGPGQLVGYPILPLADRDLHKHLRRIGRGLIAGLGALGVAAHRRPHYTGVWVGEPSAPRKVASIGIGCRRWVTWHGFALNVGPDLGPLAAIHPCGLEGDVMTSVSRELGREVTLEEAKGRVVPALLRWLGEGLRS